MTRQLLGLALHLLETYIMSDRELVDLCMKGDRVAQKRLFDTYSGQMMALCLRYAGNGSAAGDIMQEGFIKVFEKLSQYKGDGALGGWIRTIMVNSALIYLRREKKHAFHESSDEHFGLTDNSFDVFAKMGADEILQVVAKLPDGYRTVFNLFAIEGYSHKEIAEQLDISESTSKTQFHKAKQHLRKQITAMNE